MNKRHIFLISTIVGLAVLIAVFVIYRREEAGHARHLRERVLHELGEAKENVASAVYRKTHLIRELSSVIRMNPELSQQEFSVLMRGVLDGMPDVRSVRLIRGDMVTHAYPESDASGLGEEPVPPIALVAGYVQIAYLGRNGERPDEMVLHASVTVPGEGNTLVYWGAVEVAVDVRDFVAKSGLLSIPDAVRIALRAPDPESDQTMNLSGDPLVFDMAPMREDVQFFSQVWQLAAVPVGGWTRSTTGKYIIGSGVLGALLVPASLWLTLSIIMGRFEDRRKYRYLVETAKAIILRIDLSGEIEFCNEYAEQFYGYGHGELLGKPLVGTLVPEKDLEGQSMKRYIGRLLMNPSAHPFNETMNVRKNGEIVWVAWANQAVLAEDRTMVGLLSVGTDITDRKLMEESLRQREKQYRLLAENVSDVIWGLDADLRYTYVSPSDEAVRGYKRHQVLGLSIHNFLTPASANRLADVLTLLEGDDDHAPLASATQDMEFFCADGTTVWLESKLGLMLNEDGVRIGIQGVSRDITDRRRADNLREDMERMAKHDLKTPLGAVIGLPGEIRRQGPLEEGQEAMLDTIEKAGEAMLALINRSLDLYKMECGTFVLRRTPVEVVEVIECIKDEARSLIREKGISIGIEIAGSETTDSFTMDADAGLFRSMLSNMLVNALEASPESGAVSISLRKGEAVFIAIRNKGEVPREMRDVFFEKYATADKQSGSGLGTYSARLIARTHGGDISVDTTKPGETSVTVRLPF